MVTELSFVNYIFLLISSYFLIKHILFLFSDKRHIVDYVYIVFFVFYILPIVFEELYGKPHYDLYGFDKFTVVTSDLIVTSIYNFLLFIFQLVLYLKFKKRKVNKVKFEKFKFSNFQNVLIVFFIILPIILFFLFDEKEKLLSYGTLSLREVTDFGGYMNIVNSTNISILLIGGLAINDNFSFRKFLNYSPLIFIDIWLNGKRNVIVFVLVILLYIVINNRTIRLKVKSSIVLCSTLLLLLFNQYYLDNFKNFTDEQSSDQKYALFRIDYGRDHDLKMAIYHEIYDTYSPILQFRGQGMLFVATAFVPREFWPDKPLTYTAYFTSSLLNSPPEFLNFGMTTGIFDEFIVNFSIIIGFVFCVLFLFYIVNKALIINNVFFELLTIMVLVLLLTNDIKSYFLIYIIWIIVLIYLKRKLKRKGLKISH